MDDRTLRLAGQKFGRLTAISDEGRASAKDRTHRWLCVCECGRQVTVPGSRLVAGETRSCGCLQREIARAAGDRTRTHGLRNTSTYAIWRSMLARCENPKRKDYPRYGGRGVYVCARWHSFENFVADMGLRPDGLSIERENNDHGYEPGNCRWATPKEQNRNTSSSRILEAHGERLTMAEWAERTGLNPQTLQARLNRGWDTHKAISTPVDTRYSRA